MKIHQFMIYLRSNIIKTKNNWLKLLFQLEEYIFSNIQISKARIAGIFSLK